MHIVNIFLNIYANIFIYILSIKKDANLIIDSHLKYLAIFSNSQTSITK